MRHVTNATTFLVTIHNINHKNMRNKKKTPSYKIKPLSTPTSRNERCSITYIATLQQPHITYIHVDCVYSLTSSRVAIKLKAKYHKMF